MKFAYGVQGPASELVKMRLPAQARTCLLSYDQPFVRDSSTDICMFAPHSTWGAGRNALIGVLRSLYCDADYFILMDYDTQFIRGSFEAFEEALARTRPAIGFPLMPKARISPTLIEELPVQRAIALDEQCVALHRDVLGVHGIAPLFTAYDWSSWYIASYVFEYGCLSRFGGRCHQYNTIEAVNEGHVWMTDAPTLYMRGEPIEFMPLVQDAIRQVYGECDLTLIEQLDREYNKALINSRQASARCAIDIEFRSIM